MDKFCVSSVEKQDRINSMYGTNLTFPRVTAYNIPVSWYCLLKNMWTKKKRQENNLEIKKIKKGVSFSAGTSLI